MLCHWQVCCAHVQTLSADELVRHQMLILDSVVRKLWVDGVETVCDDVETVCDGVGVCIFKPLFSLLVEWHHNNHHQHFLHFITKPSFT